MSLYSEIRDYLDADVTVNAQAATVRIGWAAQSDSRPFIVIDPQSESRPARNSANTGTKFEASVDIHCHATNFEDVHDIKEAIRKRLDHYRGTMGDVFISHCFLRSVDYEQPSPRQAQEQGMFIARLSFSVCCTETNSEV